MSWEIGDRCIIDCPDSMEHGKMTTVRRTGVPGWGYDCGLFYGYEVDLPRIHKPGAFCIFEHHELRPIPDDDSRTKTTWDECVFKPLVTVDV